MTEKRFRYVEATDGVDEHIIDYSTEPHFEYYTFKGATDKLNELSNEKSHLQCRLNRRTRQRDELAEFNVELMEKNKELKDLLKSMADRNNEIWLDNGQIIRLNKVFKGGWTND